MSSDESAAERRAGARLRLLSHAVAFIVVTTALAAINLATPHRRLWFAWVLFGWGLALLWHALRVFVFSRDGALYGRMLDRQKRQGSRA
jgi:hypothetical protein